MRIEVQLFSFSFGNKMPQATCKSLRSHEQRLNLSEALCTSQDLHVTHGSLFPNENEQNVLQSLTRSWIVWAVNPLPDLNLSVSDLNYNVSLSLLSCQISSQVKCRMQG